MNRLINSRRMFTGLIAAASLAVVGASAFALAEPGDKAQGKSAEKAKAKGLSVGDKAAEFKLTSTDGKEVTLADLSKDGKVVVIEWFNPDCPFVKKHHEHAKTMKETFDKYKDKKISWVAINSGAPGEQGYGQDRNVKARKDYGMDYPVLLDEAGTVGKAYGAKRTPEFFIIGTDGTIAYHGAIDDNNDAKTVGKMNYVSAALDAILAGKKVEKAETKAYGCSVKYAK